jgi:hypothetical protein
VQFFKSSRGKVSEGRRPTQGGSAVLTAAGPPLQKSRAENAVSRRFNSYF